MEALVSETVMLHKVLSRYLTPGVVEVSIICQVLCVMMTILIAFLRYSFLILPFRTLSCLGKLLYLSL